MTQEDKNEIRVLHHAAIQGICLKYAPEAMSYGDVESMAGVPTGMVYHHAANIETSLCEMYESGGVYTETAIPATYIKRVVNIALGKRL